jgi:hypothetical protein
VTVMGGVPRSQAWEPFPSQDAEIHRLAPRLVTTAVAGLKRLERNLRGRDHALPGKG